MFLQAKAIEEKRHLVKVCLWLCQQEVSIQKYSSLVGFIKKHCSIVFCRVSELISGAILTLLQDNDIDRLE